MTQPGVFKGICRCSLRRERFSAVSILNGIKRLPTFCCGGTQEIRHQPFPVAGLFQKAVPLEMVDVFFPEIPKGYPIQSLSHRASQREN